MEGRPITAYYLLFTGARAGRRQVRLVAYSEQDVRESLREFGTRHHFGSPSLASCFQEAFLNMWGKGDKAGLRALAANPLDYLDSLRAPETEIHHKTRTRIFPNHFVEFGLRSSNRKIHLKVSGGLHDLRLEEKIRYAGYNRH